MKNLCGKTRKVNEPYEVWRNSAGWEWRVLKKWQAPDKEGPANPYARWFCAVKSPFAHGSYEMGDVYVAEIKAQAYLANTGISEKW
jgi:hypothetical protein